MPNDSVRERPVFLDDEEHEPLLIFLKGLASVKLDGEKQEKNISLTNRRCPWMKTQNEYADRLWQLVLTLGNAGAFEVLPATDKRDIDLPDYYRRRIRLTSDNQGLLCQWLGIAGECEQRKAWENAVEEYGLPSVLSKKELVYPGRNSKELAECCLQLMKSQDRKTLYQFSAQYFWGDSKYLSRQSALVEYLLDPIQIIPRKVLLHFYVPEVWNQLLLVENQDTYCYLIDTFYAKNNQIAVAYMAGYKGVGQPLRMEGSVSVHWHPESTNADSLKQDLLYQWQKGFKKPLYYWGDLDSEGLRIFKALKLQLSELQSWERAYVAMLDKLDKSHQKEKKQKGLPVTTGSDWLDRNVLPKLRQNCVDQESIVLSEL